MGHNLSRRRIVRTTKLESLEDRQMFSAEPFGEMLGSLEPQVLSERPIEQHAVPTADFWYDATLDRDLDALLGDIEQSLASAHQLTGVTHARNDYGFYGYGQTVAVIDSGIAWDHPSLGGGFGSEYRIVGGWDFTEENDANPYDDGPAGAHGTHVAGIVGATANSSGDVGVAPGVDLVGLRVFNDQGAGYFSWVEKALKWVHDNRNSFANPITAVNLSLGTAWNSATVPNWAMLEDEFAQLEADGIFIAVAAGNSFSSYNAPGLSYPAASSHVVPVMSVDDSGSFSYFSQRHSRAIAAPGRSIRSTVPDYVGNQNRVTDDWANFSGTSMASPYVAGASVLIREAMQFVGYTNVTQDTIYDHMLTTADQFFDSATNQFYKRLNVAAALDALIPDDEFGSTATSAHDLGVIGSAGADVSGLIGKLDDVDYFQFTAAATGTVTLTVDTTHELKPVWLGSGVVGPDSRTFTINVVSGETYRVGLGGTGGIGYFELAITSQSELAFVDWGAVSQTRVDGISIDGDIWYRVQATRTGYLTAEALSSAANSNVELAWFDGDRRPASAANAADGRVDCLAKAGDELFLRVRGDSARVDLRLTNLVSHSGSAVSVGGTDGDDTFSFAAGSTHILSINGVGYEFDATIATSFSFEGRAGRDTALIHGTDGDETAVLCPNRVEFAGDGFSVAADGVEASDVFAGGGNDRGMFYDSAGDDVFTARPDWARMIGEDYANYAYGFDANFAYATRGGLDRAIYHDSVGDDTFTARPDSSRMLGAGYANYANGFDANYAYATLGGLDRAVFYDSVGDDRFEVRPDWSRLSGAGFNNSARGFDANYAYAQYGGLDRAVFYDSAGDDRFEVRPDWSRMTGTGYNSSAMGFDANYAYATLGGLDRAIFYDSIGNDRFETSPNWSRMSGSGFNSYADGFAASYAYSSAGGHDTAIMHDSTGIDRLEVRTTSTRLTGNGFHLFACEFKTVTVNSIGGADQAVFEEIGAADAFSITQSTASLRSGLVGVDAIGFDQVTARAKAGETPRAELQAIDCALSLLGDWC